MQSLNNPLISVVIPNYNYAHFLRGAIESVLAQTYSNLEVIVVDDGSTDDSIAVRDEYEKRSETRVRWISQENRGLSSARNTGIAQSRGDLIAFLDADDWWQPDKLEKQLPMLRPGVGMVYTGLQLIDAQGEPLGVCLAGRCTLREIALGAGDGIQATGSSALVRRELFEQLGGFDSQLTASEDWDMWRRIACVCKIKIVRQPLVFYRQHASNMHHNIELMERNKLHAYAKMFADPAAHAIFPLKRRAYGRLYTILATHFFYARNPAKFMGYMARAFLCWPLSVLSGLRKPLLRLVCSKTALPKSRAAQRRS